MPPGNFNPYKIGLEMFRDIEDRWNKGKFGKDYDELDDLGGKKRWDKGLGLGREKIFEVRRVYNDVQIARGRGPFPVHEGTRPPSGF